MTAPVINYYNYLNDEKTMSFFVPLNLHDNTPKPTDSDIFLEDMPETTFATIRFSGYATYIDYLEQKDKLIKKLGDNAEKYDLVNMFTAGYSAPFVLFGRTNEVWLKKLN